MHIAFFVNALDSEYPRYATTVLAHAAHSLGHTVYYITPDDFVCRPDDSLCVHTSKPPRKQYNDVFDFHDAMQKQQFKQQVVDVAELDVLLLRNDPALDAEARPWAAHAGIVFGQLAAQRGIIVLNDPEGLGQAWNKLYFQTYPEEVRPKTMISKNADDIRDFVKSHRGKHILKPLQSSGGRNVFLLGNGNDNLNQIIETISEEGYIIAQAYLPKAAEGDIRLFMMNGEPLQVDGVIAALRRIPGDDDIRSNMHAGGKAEMAELTEDQLRLARLVRPKLVRDGMFLVGLDIVGDKILEVNVFSPGGLWSCMELLGVDFGAAILEAIERKVEIRERHLETFANRDLATL